MRRKENEITDRSEIEAVIKTSTVCRLGMSYNDLPYIVPLCFGYQDNTIYIHGSPDGKKTEILQKNHHVCFEFDIGTKIVEGKNPCEWGIHYKSVIGFGRAAFLKDSDEKQKALNVIMNQYTDGSFQFPDQALNRTTIIKIEIESMTGKRSK